MFTLVKMDLKQRLKSSLTWFVILILFMMSMLNIIETKDKRLNRSFEGHDVYDFVRGELWDWTYHWGKVYGEREMKLYPKAYYSESMLNKVQEDLRKTNEENDVKEITRLMSFHSLLYIKLNLKLEEDPIMSKVFEKKILKIWDDVSNGIPYDDIEFMPFTEVDYGWTNYWIVSAKYHHQLYINDMEPVYSDEVNNITYLYEYFFNILTKLIILVPILFIYNSINKEKNMGSLKLVLTQSISRRKYYIGKWISGVIHIIFTLFLPSAVISIYLGFINGFVSFKYPTIYLRNSMTSFKTIPNYFDTITMQWGRYPRFGSYDSIFSYMPPKYNYIWDLVVPHERMDIVPFYKYLLMVILLTVLFIAFAVALTQLISAIINNEIISFVAVAGVFAIGTLISSPFKYDKHLNLSPFTMEHASRIVIGTYNVTALGSTFILSASAILLLTAGIIYFKRKEI